MSKLSDRLRPGVEAAPWVIAAVKYLEALIPPDTDRAGGGVGQGTWSVFAEKVAAERDALKIENEQLRKYAHHKSHCRLLDALDIGSACSCGLDALLRKEKNDGR
jgi:hypothetical protein